MAQTKKKRRRKHRGTQGGRVEAGRSRGRPKNRSEARARARAKSGNRFDRPPTWRSATTRGIIAAVLFVVLVIVVFQRPTVEALSFGAFMLLFYIPAGYYMDQFMWKRRERARMRQAQLAKDRRRTADGEKG